MADTRETGSRGGRSKRSDGFSDEERAAMQERAEELTQPSRRSRKPADAEGDVLARIAEMPDADRAMAERVHAIVKEAAPGLVPRLWYGMPAYAKDGKVVCFFQAAAKFKARYATLGFNDDAMLDEGAMWPTSFALTGIGPAEEAAITALIEKALR